MKKIITLICFGFVTIINAQNYQLSDADCKDLWMSEILRHDTVVGSQSFGNYSIELFNPLTTTTVSLNTYSLRFLTANNTVVNIGLHGTVPSKGTWVITNSNAETSLKAISNCDTTLLNFNQYVEVKLIKTVGTTTTVIDVFGQPATPQQITFNYLLFMQDQTVTQHNTAYH